LEQIRCPCVRSISIDWKETRKKIVKKSKEKKNNHEKKYDYQFNMLYGGGYCRYHRHYIDYGSYRFHGMGKEKVDHFFGKCRRGV
jgi:hypothetical protein